MTYIILFLLSWAQQNPDLEIWFVMTSTGFNSVDYFPSSLLQKYPNLHVVGADVEKMFEGTPLLQLFQSRRWTKRNSKRFIRKVTCYSLYKGIWIDLVS